MTSICAYTPTASQLGTCYSRAIRVSHGKVYCILDLTMCTLLQVIQCKFYKQTIALLMYSSLWIPLIIAHQWQRRGEATICIHSCYTQNVTSKFFARLWLLYEAPKQLQSLVDAVHCHFWLEGREGDFVVTEHIFANRADYSPLWCCSCVWSPMLVLTSPIFHSYFTFIATIFYTKYVSEIVHLQWTFHNADSHHYTANSGEQYW